MTERFPEFLTDFRNNADPLFEIRPSTGIESLNLTQDWKGVPGLAFFLDR